MPGNISGYPTTKTGVEVPCNVTTTETAGDKCSLDVAIKEGSVTGTFTPSGLQTGGLVSQVALNSTTWTALPASAFTGRNGMGIQNDNAVQVKVNFSAGVVGFIGWTVQPNGEFFIDVSDSITVYAKSASGTPTVTIMEVA